MTTPDLRTMYLPYLSAVAETTYEVACTGAWVAAGELPVGKRRLARAAVFGAVAARAAASARKQPSPSIEDLTATAAKPPATGPEGAPEQLTAAGAVQALRTQVRPRHLVAAGAMLGLSAALTIGGKRLERRWLSRLARKGHAHPHRALAVRIAALSLAGTLPARLIDAREAGRARSSTS